MQRKAISPADFVDLADLTEGCCGLPGPIQQTANPFDWRYTRADLNDFIRKLDTSDLAQAA